MNNLMSPEEFSKAYGETFCIKPFTEICNSASNSVKLCCESDIVIKNDNRDGKSLADIFYNDDRIKDIRKKMLVGETIPQCDRCFYKERTIGTSRRIKSSILLKDQDPELFKKILQGHVELRTMDVKFGNKCNLACVMCDPGSSSLIAMDRVKNGVAEILKDDWHIPDYKDLEFPESEFERIKNYASTIRSFAAKGGEPTILPYYQEWIKFLVDTGYSKNINFLTVTNGTVDLTPMIEWLREFNNFSIIWSVDGIGKSFNYLRWPANFEKVSRNHKKIIQEVLKNNYQSIEFGFSTVSHALNIDQMVSVAKYADSLEIVNNVSFNDAHSPDGLSSGLITENQLNIFKKQVDEYCNTDGKFKKSLTSVYQMVEENHYRIRQDENNFQNLLNRLKAMTDHWKKYRGINVNDYCPTFRDTMSQLK